MAEDLTKLSDEELDARIKAKVPAPATDAGKQYDFSNLSDEELEQRLTAKIQGPSLGGEVLSAIGDVGSAVDSYTGAPTRAALSELLRTEPEIGKGKPSLFGNIINAGKAFGSQFGQDPSLAPTGKDIAEKRLGLSSITIPGTPSFGAAKGGDPISSGGTLASPAGVAGLAIDIVADPLNFVPATAMAKVAGKGVAKTAKALNEIVDATPIIGTPKKAVGRLIQDYVNPSMAKDFGKLAEVAQKNGIDISKAPEAIEFGKNSAISRAARVQAEGPLGQQRLDDYVKFNTDVSNAMDKKLQAIANGPPLDRVDAGNFLRDAYDNALDDLFTKASNGYTDVVQTYPGLKLSKEAQSALKSKLAGVEKFAKGRILRGLDATQVEQGRRLINAVKAIERGNGSVKQSVEMLRDLGDIAFKTKNSLATIPPDIQKTRELYFSLKDAINNTIETDVKDGQAIAGALKISNQMMSDFFKKRQSLVDLIGNPKLAPENLFERITSDTRQIGDLKSILRPDDFAKLKGAYLNNIVKRTDTGAIRFTPLRNEFINSKKADVLGSLFDEAELKDIMDLIDLGDRADIPIMSTSGTGASNAFKQLGDSFKSALINDTIIDMMKKQARAPVPKPKFAPPKPLFGPGGISLPEAVGLRLPQQISTQQRNGDK